MLLGLCIAALLCVGAFCLIAKAAVVVTRRLGMDPLTVVMWLGLVEEAPQQERSERRRLGELLVD